MNPVHFQSAPPPPWFPMLPPEPPNSSSFWETRNEGERFDQADEWRAREIAKNIASRKVEKMKEIAKLKAKEEKKRLESELEVVLIVENLQELRSIRIQKIGETSRISGHWVQSPPPADEMRPSY